MGGKHSNIGSKNRSRTLFLSKLAVVITLIVLQILLLVVIYGVMSEYILYWQTGAMLVSMVVVLYLVNKQENPAYKLAWVSLIVAFPLIGGLLYVLLAGNRTRLKFIKTANENNIEGIGFLPDDEGVRQEIEALSVSASVQARYISKTAGYPVYKNTSVRYFELGEENYEVLKEELRAAKHFIFMEYFIIRQGQMWETILGILSDK
ncbi:MAG: PLDc N-terminal domain-containing protein, partial [Lachnospiraceae bacterium]|nr:PLDc N-terminal domain-containing protein [Lachnospiraceae bacterium]